MFYSIHKNINVCFIALLIIYNVSHVFNFPCEQVQRKVVRKVNHFETFKSMDNSYKYLIDVLHPVVIYLSISTTIIVEYD